MIQLALISSHFTHFPLSDCTTHWCSLIAICNVISQKENVVAVALNYHTHHSDCLQSTNIPSMISVNFNTVKFGVNNKKSYYTYWHIDYSPFKSLVEQMVNIFWETNCHLLLQPLNQKERKLWLFISLVFFWTTLFLCSPGGFSSCVFHC